MAFPVEEGLKRILYRVPDMGDDGFYGLSSRRRIETGVPAPAAKAGLSFLWPFQ